MGGETVKVGDVSDVRNANPMTQNYFDQLQRMLGQNAPTAAIGTWKGSSVG